MTQLKLSQRDAYESPDVIFLDAVLHVANSPASRTDTVGEVSA